MKTVHKYEIPLVERSVIHLPRAAQLLHVERQGEQMMMWALVDPEAVREPMEFCIAGTGHEWPLGFNYVGSCLMTNGFVWHIGVERRKTLR